MSVSLIPFHGHRNSLPLACPPFHCSLASYEFSLKSKTASLSCFLNGALDPLTHNIADFKISKDKRVLIHDTMIP